MDIADIAAALAAALISGNAQDSQNALAAYDAHVASAVDEDVFALSADDDEILGEPDEMSVEEISAQLDAEDAADEDDGA